MTHYTAPVKDMLFTLNECIGISDLAELSGREELSPETLESIYEEGGKLIANVVAPANQNADQQGARFSDGNVTYPEQLRAAWQPYAAGGWAGLAMPEEYGGQGLGQLGYCPFHEMMCSGGLSFVQAPGLTLGAVEAIHAHGTESMKRLYIPKMASGEWTGTMNLTEPHAGSDVGALRSKATDAGDGTYRITGNKIYITCGELDFAENIVHLVLARLEGAPSGSRGISLFLVPKFLPNEDGSLGEQNDVRCTGIEHKLGLRGSPACQMSYGDNDGAVGWLIGEENKGLACMFTMMNFARLHVGLHGTGAAERAYQMALAYAKERVQGIPIGRSPGDDTTIIDHADVRRMLMTIRAKIAASRAICYMNAKAMDMKNICTDSGESHYWAGLSELLTPLSKAYSSDIGVECCSEAVQVFGGMGFIEETGVAQLYRDVRITPIYEGTNGIQAWDLANRKLKMDSGEHWQGLLSDIQSFSESLTGELQDIKTVLNKAVAACRETAEHFLKSHGENPRAVAAGSVAYQRLLSETVGAWLLARGASSAQQQLLNNDDASDADYLASRINLAKFFSAHILNASVSLGKVAQLGDEMIFSDSDDMLASR
ncbi:MAG: acyl-CoA dehydrogenase [Pseudomonadales bacterium]